MRLVKSSAAVLLSVLLQLHCTKKAETQAPPPKDVQVIRLAKVEVQDTSEYLGTLFSRQAINILPHVGGYVRRIGVKPGQKIETGTPLVEIDARQESAMLDSAEAQRRSAQSSLDLARQTLQRTESLQKEGLASTQELEGAQAAVEAAQAQERAAKAQVAQQQVQLQYYVVRAPFAGTVGDVLVRVGDFVTVATTITSLAQVDILEVSIAVPAERARAIKPGMDVEILDDTGKVTIATTLYFVAPQADPKTQLVSVQGVLTNSAGLRPSEIVRTRIIYGKRQGLLIPALSVTRQSGQSFVYVVTDKDNAKQVALRPVQLGTLGDQTYEVVSGLEEGELVAVSSLQSLRDGMRVNPIQSEAK